MLEFEVQPLREYFTGRFLYETAPYSPPGAEKGGTRPQRFDALARRPYWLNVARFYAGCYNSGELSSLVSGLEQLDEGASLPLSSHALRLALLFLNDWVFAQEPKTVRDVVGFLTSERNLRLLVASRDSWEDYRLALPEKSGRRELAAKAKASFLSVLEPAYLGRLGLLLRLNLSLDERWLVWQEVRARGDYALFHASCLGLFLEVEGKEKQELIVTYGDEGRRAFIVAGRWDELDLEDRVAALSAIVKRRLFSASVRQRIEHIEVDVDLFRIYCMLNPSIYSFLSFEKAVDLPFEQAMLRYGVYRIRDSEVGIAQESETGFSDVMTAAARASRYTTGQWRTSLEPWSDFVESVRRAWGDGVSTYCLAAIAAGIISKEARASGFDQVLNEKLPLVERARLARLKSSVDWWRRALTEATTDSLVLWILILLLAWAPLAVIRRLESKLTDVLTELTDDRWSDLIFAVRAVISATARDRRQLSGSDKVTLSALTSPRLKALLTLRLPRSLANRAIVELLDSYDGQDKHLGEFLASRGVTAAYREEKIWKKMLAFFARFGSGPLGSGIDHVVGHEMPYYGRNDGMPASIAQEVANNQERLPFALLEMAELTLQRQSRVTPNTLGSVALDERWFGQE